MVSLISIRTFLIAIKKIAVIDEDTAVDLLRKYIPEITVGICKPDIITDYKRMKTYDSKTMLLYKSDKLEHIFCLPCEKKQYVDKITHIHNSPYISLHARVAGFGLIAIDLVVINTFLKVINCTNIHQLFGNNRIVTLDCVDTLLQICDTCSKSNK